LQIISPHSTATAAALTTAFSYPIILRRHTLRPTSSHGTTYWATYCLLISSLFEGVRAADKLVPRDDVSHGRSVF